MTKEYNKGKERATLMIGDIVGTANDANVDKESMLKILMYMQGIHDGFAAFLSKFTMDEIIEPIMPSEFGDDMRTYMWEMVYPMSAIYTTVNQDADDSMKRLMSHHMTATLTRAMIGVIKKNNTDVADHLQVMRDTIDEYDGGASHMPEQTP